MVQFGNGVIPVIAVVDLDRLIFIKITNKHKRMKALITTCIVLSLLIFNCKSSHVKWWYTDTYIIVTQSKIDTIDYSHWGKVEFDKYQMDWIIKEKGIDVNKVQYYQLINTTREKLR